MVRTKLEKQLLKIIALLILFPYSFTFGAEGPDPPPDPWDDGPDPPPAPWGDGPDPPPAASIDDFIYPMIIIGVILSFYLFSRITKVNSSKNLKM